MMFPTRSTPLLLALAAATACDRSSAPALPASGITMLESPSGDGARFPFLAADSTGRVAMSWAERDADSVASVRFSVRLPGGAWSRPETLVRDSALLVNFADFASVVPVDDGRLVGQWLRRAPANHAYELFLAQSVNNGEIWSAAVVPHGRARPGEHGFAAMYSVPGGGAAVQYLDGSFAPADAGEMVLRHAVFDSGARVTRQATIDSRVCDCCQTDAAMTARGPVVVYRDRSPEEIRDIAIARQLPDGNWTSATVHADGWHINGCPVNGPSVAADGERVAVAWFTAARDTARVRIAFSTDAGESFGAPLDLVTGVAALGRMDVAWLADGRALVVWLERVSREQAHIKLAAVAPDHTISWQAAAGTTDAGRPSGFPRMARSGNEILVAWTATGTPTRVMLAAVTAR